MLLAAVTYLFASVDSSGKDSVIVTGSRLNQASIGHISHAIGSQNTHSAAFINAGIFVKQYGASGSVTVSRRSGDAEDVQWLWNNIPINNTMLGVADASILNTNLQQQVRVIDGSNSGAFGSGSNSATVAVNNEFLGQKSNVLLQNFIGLYGNYAGKLLWNFRKNLGFQTKLFAGVAQNNNRFPLSEKYYPGAALSYYQNANFYQKNAGASLQFKRKKFFVEAHSEFIYTKRLLPQSIYRITAPDTQVDNNFLNALYIVKKINPNLQLNQRWGYILAINQFLFEHNIASQSKHVTNNFFSQTELQFFYKWASVIAGFDFQNQYAKSNSYVTTINRNLPASFFQVLIQKNKLKCNLTQRTEWNEKIHIINTALEYYLGKNYTIMGNAGNGFRRPTLNEIYWGGYRDTLMSEKSKAAEIGLLYNSKKTNKWNLQVAYFYRKVNNAIRWVPQGNLWWPINYLSIETNGITVKNSMQWNVKKVRFSIHQLLDYNMPIIYNKNNQKIVLILNPKLTSNTQLKFEYVNNSVQLNYSFFGSRFISTDGANSLPSVHLLGLSYAQKITCSKHVYANFVLGVNNLLNYTYEWVPGYPLPCRTIHVTSTFVFN